MIARRGTPTVLYSDNATNFYGAERELAEAKRTLPDSLKPFLTERAITWKKIPPGNPSAGGAWERLVGSVKTALKVILKERAPHEEVLHTLLLESEHIVNSRPLTPVNPDLDVEALTPAATFSSAACSINEAKKKGEATDVVKPLFNIYGLETEKRLKIAVRGLPARTPLQDFLDAMEKQGHPVEYAKEIPARAGRSGSIYFVQLAGTARDHASVYGVAELLHIRGVKVEA
ncbi:uncharacterized protein LOC133531291 [Cydia pomonella]|uniref:uncharacterized protein LOC133531291 n=1 Tax=Cydia pomonella TaxID=82600 RepID=UPI002ADDFD4A|nr:uncharacterized protein LOC133531291 [Cydia pomonella]